MMLESRWSTRQDSVGIVALGAVHTSSGLAFLDASAALRPAAVRLLGTYDYAVDSGLSLVAGAGGGLDRYGIESPRGTPGVRISSPGSTVDPVLGGLFGIHARLVDSTFLTAAVALDVDLAPSRYVAVTEDGRESLVLEVPRVRPTLWLGWAMSVIRPSHSPPTGARP
jgi:hypothetical protein